MKLYFSRSFLSYGVLFAVCAVLLEVLIVHPVPSIVPPMIGQAWLTLNFPAIIGSIILSGTVHDIPEWMMISLVGTQWFFIGYLLKVLYYNRKQSV
jgi:hypothetical protein